MTKSKVQKEQRSVSVSVNDVSQFELDWKRDEDRIFVCLFGCREVNVNIGGVIFCVFSTGRCEL